MTESNVANYRVHAHLGTVRQLEILLRVFELGGISRAAEVLHLTQPTVSMQLAKLAHNLGGALYYTRGKKLQFTEMGVLVVESARDILKAYDYLDIKLLSFKGLEAGSLRLGLVTTAKYFIPHLVGEFADKHPKIEIQLNVGNREQVIERTRTDRDDFYVFSHPPADPDFELIEFLPNHLQAIAPINHPLTKKKTVSLKQFATHPFLMREAGSGTRYALERFLKKKQIELNVRMTIESNEAIKHAVMSGLGVSILSEHTLRFGGLTGLQIVNVTGLPIKTQWYLVRRRSRPLSPIAGNFLDYAKAQRQRANNKDLLTN